MRRLAVIAALVFFARVANAQAPDADQLFSEGVALIGEEKYAEALAKLEQAQAIDPGIGTQFNIGVCYAKLGKLATAWRNFRTVQQLAHASGKTAREESARQKLEELRPQLSIVAIRVTDSTDTTIKVDGLEIPRSEWASYPVDPGAHKLEALAPTRIPFEQAFDAPAAGDKLPIIVPALASSKQVVTVTHETTNTRRAIGLAAGGLGVAGLTVATVTGVILLHDHAVAQRDCTPRCLNQDGTLNQRAVSAVEQGNSLGPINIVAWVVGVAGVGVGTYFLLTSTKKAPAVARALLGLETVFAD